MEYGIHHDGSAHRVVMRGKFVHTDYGRVTQIIDSLRKTGGGGVTIDLSGVDFIDSGGIGMLLLLRESCSHGGAITLHGAVNQPRTLLLNAHMSDLFRITE